MPVMHMCEELVPILHDEKKSHQFFTGVTNTFQLFTRQIFFYRNIESKKEGKDQELIQSRTTPDPGYIVPMGSDNKTSQTRAKRSALSQQVTPKYRDWP